MVFCSAEGRARSSFESTKEMLQAQGTQLNHKSAYMPQSQAPARSYGGAPGVAAPLPKYLRLAQLVPDVIPVSRATIWRWVKSGEFPAPIKLAERVTAWKLEEVLAWLDGR